MERWTIAEPADGRYALHINHGGPPFWCMFDFALRPDLQCGGFQVTLDAGADAASVEWFPHLQRGMLRAAAEAREQGREWVGVRVEVRRVHVHPTDTTVSGCEHYGFLFVTGELTRRGAPMSRSEP